MRIIITLVFKLHLLNYPEVIRFSTVPCANEQLSAFLHLWPFFQNRHNFKIKIMNKKINLCLKSSFTLRLALLTRHY